MEKAKEIFNKYKMIVLMNIIIFALLFFGLGLLVVPHFKAIIWRILFVLFIIVTTDIFYLFKKIKYEQVLLSLPILYILNLIFLRYCALRDLFGITNYEIKDKCPAFIDALLIDIIIVFIEYLTLLITRFIVGLINKKKDKKEEKVEVKNKTKVEKKKEVKKDTKKTNSKKGKKI